MKDTLQRSFFAPQQEGSPARAVRRYWQRCDPDDCDGDGAKSFRTFRERIDVALETAP